MPQAPDLLGTLLLTTLNAAVNLGDGHGAVASIHIVQVPAWGTGGTVAFEGTVDGTTWGPILAVASDSVTGVTTATTAGIYRLDATGLTDARLRVSIVGSSGTINIYRARPRAG